MAGEIFELVEEEARRPEIRRLVFQMGGAAAAELVVVDNGAAGPGQRQKRIQIVVRAAGSAVKSDQRQLAAAQVTSYAIPSLPTAKVCMTLAHGSECPVHAGTA